MRTASGLGLWGFDAEYFDDDGWSSRDSGGRYTNSGTVSALPTGRVNRSATSPGAWNLYWYTIVEG